MHRDPDFLAVLTMNEEEVAALPGASLDEAAASVRGQPSR
jgi:hypothetical protein